MGALKLVSTRFFLLPFFVGFSSEKAFIPKRSQSVDDKEKGEKKKSERNK